MVWLGGALHGLGWLYSGTHGMIIESIVACGVTGGATDAIVQWMLLAEQKRKDEEKEKSRLENNADDEETEEDSKEDVATREFSCFRMWRVVTIGAVYGPFELFYFWAMSGLKWYQQVGIDNTVFIPTMYITGIIMNKYMRDGTLQELAASGEFCKKFGRMMMAGLPVWLVGDTIMFTCVPLRHRVLFSRLVGFFITLYNTHVLNMDDQEVAARKKMAQQMANTPGADTSSPALSFKKTPKWKAAWSRNDAVDHIEHPFVCLPTTPQNHLHPDAATGDVMAALAQDPEASTDFTHG